MWWGVERGVWGVLRHGELPVAAAAEEPRVDGEQHGAVYSARHQVLLGTVSRNCVLVHFVMEPWGPCY